MSPQSRNISRICLTLLTRLDGIAFLTSQITWRFCGDLVDLGSPLLVWLNSSQNVGFSNFLVVLQVVRETILLDRLVVMYILY